MQVLPKPYSLSSTMIPEDNTHLSSFTVFEKLSRRLRVAEGLQLQSGQCIVISEMHNSDYTLERYFESVQQMEIL